jgi:rSAM/selenodomain-associated transferase 2
VKLSVIIPAFDEAAQIGDAVRAALAPDVEVLVIDGGSGDTTAPNAEAAGARVLTSARGRARQLSAGARESRGDVLIFVHADTRLPSGFDAAVRDALEEPSAVGGAFRLRFDRRTLPLRVIEAGARARARLLGLPYGDQALFIRRATLDAIGGVPQVPIMEDLDMVRAMKRHGHLVQLPLDAVTSARRHCAGGPFRVAIRHALAVLAWALGVSRARIAAWIRE